jgi:hypothetical protein
MALSLLAAILGFLWKSEKSKRFREKAKAEKDRADAQKIISEELVKGEERQQERIQRAKDTPAKRGRFT